MKDYKVMGNVKNNQILKAIEDSGGKTGVKWCKENGLSYKQVNDLVSLRSSPISCDGHLTLQAQKICDVLGKIPDELWSNEQLYPLEKNFSEIEMSLEEVMGLLPHEDQIYFSDFESVERYQLRENLGAALDMLKKSERMVLMLRYLDSGLTQEQCGDVLGVSATRVGQIEWVALRKLRKSKLITY